MAGDATSFGHCGVSLCRNLCRLGEVVFSDREVMPGSDPLAVADPLADDVKRMLTGQFCFAGCSEVVEQLRPRGQPRPVEDSQELSSEVRSRLADVAVARDDVLGSFGRFIERRFQVGTEFREQRDDSFGFPFVMLRLR